MLKALFDGARLWFWRIAASGLLPARLVLRDLPPESQRAARRGPLSIEIVSHCWNYSHLLVYQLSSLALAPPADARLTMTVFYAREDLATRDLLDFIGAQEIPGVSWNWQELPPEYLFRRSIGRNLAALQTQADWVWFTDCDLVFAPGCLDHLVQALQDRRDALVYPRVERVTTLLAAEDPLLKVDPAWTLRSIDASRFEERAISRATGPLQITHGDVARAVGYCRDLALFQEPVPRFAKCHEDRVFRWLLGTQGVPVDVPGVYRIRHVDKGRYRAGIEARLRGGLRQARERRISGG